MFLFLSAYGLVMKYEKRGALSPKQTNVVPFLKHHYVKLFKMMIVGFVAFTMVDAITPGRTSITSWTYSDRCSCSTT